MATTVSTAELRERLAFNARHGGNTSLAVAGALGDGHITPSQASELVTVEDYVMAIGGGD